MEDPPKKFFRLSPGREVRLRYGYLVTCEENRARRPAGEVVALRCRYDPASKGGNAPDGRKVQATFALGGGGGRGHRRRVRLYEQPFTRPDPGTGGDVMADLNPASKEILTDCLLEPALATALEGDAVQFERLGYFCRDQDSTTARPVFNRTVGLRDTWAKVRDETPRQSGKNARTPR